MFLFTRLLQSAGAKNPLQIVLNGREAIARLARVMESNALPERPAAVFLDVRLPGLDGFEVLTWIREVRAFDRLPVILLCQTANPAEVARAKQLGAQCLLPKFPAQLVIAQALDEARAFGLGGWPRIFDIPHNLLH